MEKCSQCLGIFTIQNQPFLMPECQHNICKRCVGQVIVQQGLLECEFCGIQKSIDRKSEKSKASLFKKNQKLVRTIRKQKIARCRSDTNLLSLGVANDINNDESFLNISHQLLNKTSLKQNKQSKKTDQNPEFQKFSKQLSKDIYFQKQVCQSHQRERNIVCLTDKVRICQFCAIFGSHKDHQFLSLKQFEAQISKKSEKLSAIKPLKQSLRQFFTQNGFSKCFEDAINSNRKDNQFKIKIHFLKIQQDIKKLQTEAFRKLNEAYSILNKQIFMNHQQLASNYEQIRSEIQNWQNILAKSQQKQTLQKRMDYILKSSTTKDCLSFFSQIQQEVFNIENRKNQLLVRTLTKSEQISIQLKDRLKLDLNDILTIQGSTNSLQPETQRRQFKYFIDQENSFLIPFKETPQSEISLCEKQMSVNNSFLISSVSNHLQKRKQLFQETSNLFNIKSGNVKPLENVRINKSPVQNKQTRLGRCKSDLNLLKDSVSTIQKEPNKQKGVMGIKISEREVNLSHLKLGDSQIVQRIFQLQVNPILINLSNNSLTEQGLKRILPKLFECRKIDLSNNKQKKGSLDLILQKISEFKKLKILVMTANQISFKSGEIFKNQFKKKGVNLII